MQGRQIWIVKPLITQSSDPEAIQYYLSYSISPKYNNTFYIKQYNYKPFTFFFSIIKYQLGEITTAR